MDEDAGVKAPVTRLRRRMSVEQTEEKSPAVSTPTKKRGGRKTAKTDLELIDENTPDNTTTRRTTKKTAAKDVIDTSEEKPMTPSRCSTRIRSNTSIVAETATIDSPRAKRAARRTSQVGSDSEAPATPVRQTRRTRKDSASSIEKGEILSIPKSQISEAIAEEPENDQRKSINNMNTSNNKTPTNVRKSPRLVEKSKKRNSNDTEEENSNQASDVLTEIKEKTPSKKSVESLELSSQDSNTDEIKQKDKLSISTSNLIENLITEPKPKSMKLNKSTSAVGSKNNVKKERVRTKSWNINSNSNEPNFFSDNESLKKKISKENKKPAVVIERYDTSDTINTSKTHDKSTSKKKQKNSSSFTVEAIDTSLKNTHGRFEHNEDEIDSSSKNNQSLVENPDNAIIKLFDKEPSNAIQTLVYIQDDSDSNSGKAIPLQRHENEDQCVPVVDQPNQHEKEHSLIPVISENKEKSYINKSKSLILNNSCEPMDIDETIPETHHTSEINSPKRKSISTINQLDLSEVKENCNKSNRKSSISNTFNKTENENKSTLILSQLKDASIGDTDNAKSPLIKNSILLKTDDNLNSTQDNEVNKKNVSLTYVTTSTPLQQKRLQKLGTINTSIITNAEEKDSINKSKVNVEDNIEVKRNTIAASNSKTNINNISFKEIENKEKSVDKTDSEDSISDNESSKKENKSSRKSKNNMSVSSNNDNSIDMDSDESKDNNNMLDDEAEDAGDDYESGDSQNEEERQYLKDNEILEKGETLSSDGDISNDSDYEKDSFVVSSDPEDDELLEGTEDDLSMSENELKMTTKSKKKYDERKTKESKKASREMYESRHKLNDSNKSNTSEIRKLKKNKRQQLSSSESEEEVELKKKKTNRMRLDSSHETSLLVNNESKISIKKSKNLSESSGEEQAMNEKEITISNETIKENDPLANIKLEPKTPQGNASIAFADTDKDPNNDSELTRTQTELDPLDDPMTADSLSSDNEKIMQNYDSILEGLNKSNKMKSKVSDTSLNIEKKKSKKEKNTIIDELNLTQVKSAKKLKTKAINQNGNKAKDKTVPKPDLQDSESSDSIDLHLLFSEDSSSDDTQSKENNRSNINDEFISLKKTKGRISSSENADKSQQDQSLNLSVNQKDSEDVLESQNSSDGTENDVNFFIDTEGTNKSINKNLNTSMKNKKANSDNDSGSELQNEENNDDEAVNEDSSDSDTPMEVSFKKDKKKSQTENNDEHGEDETDCVVNKSLNKSVTKTPVATASGKKKRKSQDFQISKEIDIEQNQPNDKSIKTPKSEKKKQKTLTIKDNLPDESQDVLNISKIKTPGSQRKKKLSIQAQDKDDELDENQDGLNISKIKTPGSQRKKKLSIQAQDKDDELVITEALNNSKIKTPGSEKKKGLAELLEQDVEEAPDQNIILGSGKKSKKSHSNSFSLDVQQTSASELYDTTSKKRKRNSSLIPAEENINKDKFNTSQNLNESVVGSEKKKRKISENEVSLEDVIHNKINESLTRKKKRNISQIDNNVSDIRPVIPASEESNKPITSEIMLKNEPETSGTSNIAIKKKNKTKKRKEREDDEVNNTVKVLKENSFDKIHIQRLPASILNKLDDKPKQGSVKELKVVSTSNFLVEEAKRRKNKPSNFLEETICLNEDKTESKKHKKRLLKPKVLPFVPTAITSASGFTTNFKVNIIPRETKFIAQSNTVTNYKDDFLFNKKIKRQNTYELYKRQRNIKISKF